MKLFAEAQGLSAWENPLRKLSAGVKFRRAEASARRARRAIHARAKKPEKRKEKEIRPFWQAPQFQLVYMYLYSLRSADIHNAPLNLAEERGS